MDKLEAEVISGKRDPEHEKEYAKYFEFHETPVRGLSYSFKEDAIRKAEKDYGYFVLMSNEIKDPVLALQIYRAKDLIEKSFGKHHIKREVAADVLRGLSMKKNLVLFSTKAFCFYVSCF